MKNKILILLAILLLVVIIAGIFVTTNINNNSETKEDTTLIKVNEVTRSVFYAPQYVAISNGYFKDYGIEIDLTTGQGAETPPT